MTEKALIVLSGGQDSTTCLHQALKDFGKGNVFAIAFDYGQKHSVELTCAAFIARMAGVELEIISVRGILVSMSPLTNPFVGLDRYESFGKMEAEVGDKVEKTFVPMRNSLFLTIAANRALSIGCTTVVTGVCGQDNANYPDCTEEFVKQIETSINQSLGFIRYEGSRRLVDERYITISAPLMFMSKADTVQLAVDLGPQCLKALAYSHTSYDGKYPPTDPNHSNLLRAQGFLEADTPDPLVVRAACEGLMYLPDTDNYSLDIVESMCREIGTDFQMLYKHHLAR